MSRTAKKFSRLALPMVIWMLPPFLETSGNSLGSDFDFEKRIKKAATRLLLVDVLLGSYSQVLGFLILEKATS